MPSISVAALLMAFGAFCSADAVAPAAAVGGVTVADDNRAAQWRLPDASPAAVFASAGLAAPPPPGPEPTSWPPPLCALTAGSTGGRTTEQGAVAGAAAVWFASSSVKVFEKSQAPATPCGSPLRVSAAKGERLTFQLAVRFQEGGRPKAAAADNAGTAVGGAGNDGATGGGRNAGPSAGSSRTVGSPGLTGVTVSVTGLDGATVVVRRAAFTNVSTAANNVTSLGVGMYPDPLPLANDTTAIPRGGGTVDPGVTAVFWVAVDVPVTAAPGVRSAALTVSGTGVASHPLAVLVRNFTLPDAAHASQWTEADPFGSLIACNDVAVATRPPGCPVNHTDFPKNEKPCLEASVVDDYYAAMADNRINRLAWIVDFDFAAGVGLVIANDTQSVTLDTAAFDRSFANLVRLGYRDLRFPVPACLSGSSCGLDSAAGIDPNTTWVFGNSTGWYGSCPAKNHGRSVTCVNGFPPQTLVVPIFDNATLNQPSAANASLAAWQTQRVGDAVRLNPEFVRLFRLVMAPMAAHLDAKGWINRTFAFLTDEPRWPCYSGGTNFTVNAFVAFAELYRSLHPAIRVQQDLTPMAPGEVWDAVAPVVDAWVWQEGQFQFGVPSGTGAKAERIVSQLELVASARRAGKAAYIYNNGVAIVDMHAHRVRTFPWQIWRTNYAYNVSRHAGLQGSLSWFALTAYFGSDPWAHANVLCGDPLGESAHPVAPSPKTPPCKAERAAGEWFTLYPPSDGDICHKGPTPSVRWELLRKGLEDVEYLAMLDRLAGEADAAHACGYEDAVLAGRGARVAAAASSPCCGAVAAAKSALDAVDDVTWGITATGYGPAPSLPYNVTESEPYTTDPAVLQRVIDGAADAIERVQGACSVGGG